MLGSERGRSTAERGQQLSTRLAASRSLGSSRPHPARDRAPSANPGQRLPPQVAGCAPSGSEKRRQLPTQEPVAARPNLRRAGTPATQPPRPSSIPLAWQLAPTPSARSGTICQPRPASPPSPGSSRRLRLREAAPTANPRACGSAPQPPASRRPGHAATPPHQHPARLAARAHTQRAIGHHLPTQASVSPSRGSSRPLRLREGAPTANPPTNPTQPNPTQPNPAEPLSSHPAPHKAQTTKARPAESGRAFEGMPRISAGRTGRAR
ncbi:hypothetical protein DEU36_2580 [Microbacterium sp. AG238]|nr:hypothetical protein DEU36_2580 [Microbacterium sp. AG238]